MTPHAFITKWRASALKERSASQEHFIDLCHLLGEPTPAEADPSGETYCFERGARKDTGGDGWADVWKRHHFAWEYKGQRADLDAAFGQLRQYSLALENPPLLIVSDMVRFRIRTNWTNSVSRTHEFELEDLADASTRDRLKWAFSDPDRLRPGETRQSLTERVAASFASVAQSLRERGHDPQAVAHFVNRLVFCMFADDVGLLPDHMFTRMLRHARPAPERFTELAGDLFEVMATGGRVGFETVAWFNGGLFDDSTVLPLEKSDIETVLAASDLDWSEIDPSILGTLFERGLDPGKRAQLGAHYTDRDKIMLLVEPVVIRPLLVEWEAEKTAITAELERAEAAKSSAARTKRRNEAERRLRAFLERLRRFTVLDPACGSGNFLYLALQALKDLDAVARVEDQRDPPARSDACVNVRSASVSSTRSASSAVVTSNPCRPSATRRTVRMMEPDLEVIRPPAGDRAPPGRGLGQPEHPAGLRRRAPPSRRLARRPAAPRCDPGRLPRRAARRRPRLVERLDGGRRGVLPREARRAAHSRRRADGPGAGWVPADRRRRSGARSGAAVRGLGPGGRARHLPPAAASSPTRSPSSAGVSMR